MRRRTRRRRDGRHQYGGVADCLFPVRLVAENEISFRKPSHLECLLGVHPASKGLVHREDGAGRFGGVVKVGKVVLLDISALYVGGDRVVLECVQDEGVRARGGRGGSVRRADRE